MITGVTTTSFDQWDPGIFDLSGNYPNPFDQKTTVEFELHQQAKVTLSVYNFVGQRVFEVTESGLSPGMQALNFDASNLSSGIYLYKINATSRSGKNYVGSKKMIIAR